MSDVWDDTAVGDARDDAYALWDAAYVLGVLSMAERREFEAHLIDCAACRAAVADLAGIPAVLSQVDGEWAVRDEEAGPTSPPAELLASLLSKARVQRRRSRLVTAMTVAAAAAVRAGGVLVGVAGRSAAPPQPSAAVMPMQQVATSTLISSVSLHSEQWGTFIAIDCICLAPLDAPHDKLAMVVVGRDGSRSQLATWVAQPGHTATPTASTSIPSSQIAAVQVVSAEGGQVLLQRSL